MMWQMLNSPTNQVANTEEQILYYSRQRLSCESQWPHLVSALLSNIISEAILHTWSWGYSFIQEFSRQSFGISCKLSDCDLVTAQLDITLVGSDYILDWTTTPLEHD
jgi:hypothetical protein